MALRAVQRKRFAETLLDAASARAPLRPLTEEQADLTLADAYAIQRELLRLRRRSGDRRIGWKVGLTSAATRAELGMDQPIAGHLVASGCWTSGEAVRFDRFLAPGVEPEIAIVMGRDVAGPRVTPLDVLRAAEGVMAVLEVVDSRFKDWKGTIVDGVADDAFHAGLVVSGRLLPAHGLDLRLEGVTVERSGRLAATAAGAAALGHPLNAVAWLAAHLAGLGSGIKAGDIVLTGSLTPIVRPERGDVVRATFTHLGPVSVGFA